MSRPVALGPSTLVRQARAIPFTPVGDDHLAIDAESGSCWALDRVGARVWALLDPPVTLASLCSRLREEFEVDEETCRRDVTQLLERLLEEGLVLATDG